jgi:hypothetical protein
MKIFLTMTLALGSAALLVAQGPGPGGFGGPGGGFGGGFGGFGGRGPGILGAGPGPRTVVTGEPYSATETLASQQTLQNGNQITRNLQSLVARDGQGRVRTEETIPANAASGRAARTIVTIFDPVAGYRYILDSSTMTAIQTPLPKPPAGTPPARPARPANPNGPQVATTSLGTQVINGVAATGTQITETIPAGAIGNAQPIQVVRVTWISNELKVPVQIRSSDPRFGSTDMELTAIVQAEPNASLFVVPAGYTTSTGRGPGGFGPQGFRRKPPAPPQ